MHKIYVGIHITGFPCGSAGKESICNVGDLGSIPGLERSPGEGKGYLLQYSGLENSMNCIVYGIAKSQVWLSNFWAFLVAQLVKKPPAMQDTWVWSLGWEDPLEKGKGIHPVFWPGEFHGLYSPWVHKESDTTEQPSLLHVTLEKEMATHFDTLAWEIPWTEEPGGVTKKLDTAEQLNNNYNTHNIQNMC